jgi:hypothetical protein
MENKLAFKDFEQIPFPNGDFFRANKKKFPALRGLAVQVLKLKPGAVREPHSHPNAEQLDYCVSGKARVGIVGPEGHKQFLDLQDGDISFVPRGYVTFPLCREDTYIGFRIRDKIRFTSS